MRSNEGLEQFGDDQLYGWLNRYRDDIRNMADYPAIGWKAHAWATQTCARIVLILARKQYDPKTKKPPRAVACVAAVSSTPFQETHQS